MGLSANSSAYGFCSKEKNNGAKDRVEVELAAGIMFSAGAKAVSGSQAAVNRDVADGQVLQLQRDCVLPVWLSAQRPARAPSSGSPY